MSDQVELGICRMGNQSGKPFIIKYPELVRHVLAVGGTGSGKTAGLKRIAESMLADGIPIVAVDVLGDISGLAVPAQRKILAAIGKTPTTEGLTEAEYNEVVKTGEALAEKIYPRILTPCSDMCERMALTPVPQRPKNFAELADTDRDYLVLWADSGAGAFMERLGLGVSKAGGPPDVVRGIITDALMAAWEQNMDLTGVNGLQAFGGFLEQWGAPPLPDKALSKIKAGIAGLSVGAEALWHKGTLMDFSSLLEAPPGKVPLIVVNVAHLPRPQHPWVVAQVINGVWAWALSKGSSGPRPRVGIFLDELAGERGHNAILPPATYKSFSGEAIRRILRQGRHFGVTLLAGTQSPTDVDSTSFINFTNRLIGKIIGDDKAKIALQGAQIQEGKRDFLLNLLGKAQQGQMFALTASGGFEAVKMHWLSTVHDKFTPEQYRQLYTMGILKRAGVKRTTMKDVPGSIMRLANDLKDRLDQADWDTLKSIAAKYQR